LPSSRAGFSFFSTAKKRKQPFYSSGQANAAATIQFLKMMIVSLNLANSLRSNSAVFFRETIIIFFTKLPGGGLVTFYVAFKTIIGIDLITIEVCVFT